MADSVSSIITIAHVSLALIQACKNYIDEVRGIDDLVDQLLREITELHELVRLVNSQYHQAEPDGTSEPSVLVCEKIALCRKRFRVIKSKIPDFKTQKTVTLRDKVSLKRKMDAVASDIESAVKDIERYLDHIRLVTGVCSYFDITSYIRRVSGATAPQPMVHGSTDDQPTQDDTISAHRRSSTTETSEPLQFCADSPPTIPPRLSVSSSSWSAPLTQSDDDESILTRQTSICSTPSEDWKAFHCKVSQCNNDPVLIAEIRSMLEQHPEPSTLVNILGDHQRAPLHLAAQRGYVNLAHVLLEFGADVNAKDTEPASVLDHAVANNQTDFITLILDMGADKSGILERNKQQLEQKKAVIALRNRKKRQQSLTTAPTRRFSFSLGRIRSH